MTVFFLGVHVLICIVVLILMKLHILKSSSMVIVFMLLVPVWGMLCLIILEWHTRRRREIFREIDVDRLLINDEIHRSILMDEETMGGRIVPLGEAFVVDDTATQRQLMMEVMYEDPNDYVSQLQDARMNNDTEVVHYAVTALTEMQKEYDLQFQRLDRLLALNPKDDHALNEYISLEERYLSSGLISGSARNMALRIYSDLLDKKLKKNETASLWAKKISADLATGEYETAYEAIEHIIDLWPGDENGYLFLLRYHVLVRDRAGINQVLEMIRQRDVHLSPNGRSTVTFWSRQNQEEKDGNTVETDGSAAETDGSAHGGAQA